MSKLIFVTGTDTGVGKTVVAVLLLRHLRNAGVQALGVKPFCSGDREDARRLCRAQNNELTLDECNPFYFPAPLAPAEAARQQGRSIRSWQVRSHIERVRKRCDVLVVEGAGGLLVPLGQRYTVVDLMEKLGVDGVVIVAPNRLGTINHTLLTHRVLAAQCGRSMPVEIVLNSPAARGDLSSQSNEKLIRQWLPAVPITALPFMGANPWARGTVDGLEKKMKKVLARILGSANFAARQTRRTKKSSQSH